MLSDANNRNFSGKQTAGSQNYYSGIRFRNYDDHNELNFTFGIGLLRIGISKEGDDHRYTEEINASVPPKKALVLLDQIKILEEKGEGIYGTTLGLGDVQTAIAIQFKDDNRYVRIAKVNKDGRIQDQRTFCFYKNSDAGYNWSDFDNMKFTKNYNNDIDFETFKTILADFARGMSGAFGYGTLYLNRYQDNSMTNKINAALEKLGVPINRGGNRGSNYSNSNGYFNSGNNSGGVSQNKSYSDIESMIGDEDE